VPYIGKQPKIGAYKKLDAITVVNGQAAYTLQSGSANYSPASANHLIVSLNGVIQAPQDSFTVSGSTLTFASNLVSGDIINYILALGDVLSVGTPSDNTVTNDKLATAPIIISKGAGSDSGAIKLNCEQNSHGVTIKGPPHSAAQSYTLTLPSTAPSANKALITDGSGNLSFGSAGVFGSALLHLVDEKANNTSPQTFSTGQNTRELTTVKTNEITGASLGSNQITLPSGTYYAEAEANGYVNARHKISLYNTTDSSYTLVGLSSNSHASYYTTSPSMLKGRFTISAQKVFELRHYIQSGSASGIATNASLVEIYANIRIWKVG